MTKQQLIDKLLQEGRRKTKTWRYTMQALYNGKYVEIKAYKNWLQVCRIDGIEFGGMDYKTLRELTAQLHYAFDYQK